MSFRRSGNDCGGGAWSWSLREWSNYSRGRRKSKRVGEKINERRREGEAFWEKTLVFCFYLIIGERFFFFLFN